MKASHYKIRIIIIVRDSNFIVHSILDCLSLFCFKNHLRVYLRCLEVNVDSILGSLGLVICYVAQFQ